MYSKGPAAGSLSRSACGAQRSKNPSLSANNQAQSAISQQLTADLILYTYKNTYIINIMGQLQKPVELLKNYPNINLFVGNSFLDQHRDAIGRALSTNCLHKQGYIKLLSRIHYPHLALKFNNLLFTLSQKSATKRKNRVSRKLLGIKFS